MNTIIVMKGHFITLSSNGKLRINNFFLILYNLSDFIYLHGHTARGDNPFKVKFGTIQEVFVPCIISFKIQKNLFNLFF